MVNAKSALLEAVEILKNSIKDEALPEARLLFNFVTNQDSRLVGERDEISVTEYKKLISLCKKRATRYPLQYILGQWQFMGLQLKVGEGVLIPRFDTETVCLAAAEKCKLYENPVVLDLCAGSGAISLGINSLVPKADITAVELFDKAFEYLKANSHNNIQCVKEDVLLYQLKIPDNSVDIIVSNPPYVTADEMRTLEPELYFEPESALTDNSDGLSFYRHIASAYFNKVTAGGWLVFEIGSTQANDVKIICEEAKWQVCELLFDLNKTPRAVVAQK